MLESLGHIVDFISSGIYGLFTEAMASLMEWLILTSLDYTIWAVSFSWNIAQNVLADLHISEHLATAWAALPSNVASIGLFFRLPEVITNLLSAGIARIVLRYLPSL